MYTSTNEHAHRIEYTYRFYTWPGRDRNGSLHLMLVDVHCYIITTVVLSKHEHDKTTNM